MDDLFLEKYECGCLAAMG